MNKMGNVVAKEYFDDNFFVIESDNLDDIEGRIYGYAMDGDKIIINSNECNYALNRECYGSYVNVVTKSDTIEIYQDYFGSYGIYLYNFDGYFALSNSFLYLVNFLKNKKNLTFNDEYAKAFLGAPQAALAYQDTMVKEIIMLPRNSFVRIFRESGKIYVERYEQKETYIDINSIDALKIIDEWHSKWNNIFRTIYKENLYLSFGISGGKDSRVSLACCLKPKLKLDEICFVSSTDNLATHSDDYRIAKKMADEYGFTLNTGAQPERFRMDPLENLNSSLLAKCGFHREIMPSHFWHKKPSFRITGSGGDLRELWGESAESFIERMCNDTVFNSIDCREALRKVMYRTKTQIDNCGGENYNYVAKDYFYKQARQRNHNGKANVETFMSNVIILSPLMDPALYKINQNIGKANDNDLLYALIYKRYLPEIFDLEFDSGRIVKKETMEIACEINSLYTFDEKKSGNARTFKLLYTRVAPEQSNDKLNAHDYLKKLFYSQEVKKFSDNVFGEEVYKRADIYYRTRDYHPYIAGAGLVESYIIYEAVQKSHTVGNYSGITELIALGKDTFVPINYNNNGFMKACFDYLQSARFDIKNYGTCDNEIKFISSNDESVYVSTPDWFIDNRGKGKVFQSYRGKIKIGFQIISEGNLSIKLMGPWIKDDENQLLSVKIDIIKMSLKDVETNDILFSVDDACTVDSSNVLAFTIKDCKDRQKFVLEVEWLPYIYKENELFNLLEKMYCKSIGFFEFWKNGDKML